MNANHEDLPLANNLWNEYKTWIRLPKNQAMLALGEEAISRIVWLLPFEREPKWRQLIWAILQLHRVVMDVAMDEGTGDNQYGATVSVGKTEFPAAKIRMALSIIQSIVPFVQQMSDGSQDLDPYAPNRGKYISLWIERIRFVLRASMLLSYWQQFDLDRARPGLLQLIGINEGPQQSLTTRQEVDRMRREDYSGSRTGRRVVHQASERRLEVSKIKNESIRIMIGEFLYIFRPLFWAQAGATSETMFQAWQAWIATLGIDAASLILLRKVHDHGNQVSMTEYNRRKMRIFLYLLRSPVWESVMEAHLARITGITSYIPFLGRIFSYYMYDWLYYWKYYRCEEG